VSNPAAIRQASLKPLQLQLATELGFEVPHFTITNDVDHAARFIKACPSGAIVKVLVNPSIMYADHVQLLYTHLLTGDDHHLLDAVRGTRSAGDARAVGRRQTGG